MNQLPKWTKIYPPLSGLAKVATCKTVLQIIRSILFYALYTDKLIASRAPDVVLITALHLLSLALDISQAQIESQSGGFDNSIPLLVFAAEEISTGLNDGYDDQSLLSLLVSLMRINKKENAYNYVESGGFDLCSLIKNLLQKFAELDVRCLTKLQMLAPEVVNQLSYSSDVSNNSAPVSDSEKRKAKARERQAAIMKKMKAQQSKFMENMTEDTSLDDTNDPKESLPDVTNDSEVQVVYSLCQDANSETPVSFLILLQKSRLVSLLDKGPPSWEKEAQRSGKEQVNEDALTIKSSETLNSQLMELVNNPSSSSSSSSSENVGSPSGKAQIGASVTSWLPYDGFGPSDCNGIYVISCGHAVHQGCLDRYLRSLKERYTQRIDFEGGHIVDPDQGEFLCPVCQGLAYSILPDLPREGMIMKESVASSKIPNLSPMDPANYESSEHLLLLKQSLSLLQASADVSRRNELLKSFPVKHKGGTDATLEYVVHLLHEISEKTSHATNYSISSLYEELRSSSGFILSLLLKIVHSIRAQNSLDVLLRLRCIQQFAKSIHADTLNELPGHTNRVEDNMMSILENADMGIRFPDVQFWTMASNPVLASDPFSTLMWILFCLPVPFMSSDKSFLPLVHMCYVVSITQAVITYFGKNEYAMDDFSYHESLITDIYKFMGEHVLIRQYFVSIYIDSSHDIKETIRSLSFPFLRRCALLWKLMNSSSLAPFSGVHRSSQSFEDRMDFAYGFAEEFVEIEELEMMFKIPTLENIVNDEVSRSLVLKWLHHFAREFEVGVLYTKQKCVDCGAVQDEPALCLLCGKLCSPSWKTCCSIKWVQGFYFHR
ncbi:hypothetical protein Lser_V15G03398 [Lactuca serriola]